MRNYHLHLFLSAVLLLLGIQAIAQSEKTAENNVILHHYWSNSNTTIDCPETGIIDVSFSMHVIEKVLPDGKESYHANCNGEGDDEFGGKWRFHQTNILIYKLENGAESDLLYLDHIMLHGPKGKQLRMKIFFLERDGSIVVLKSEPLCD